jgi:hypothetical protein
LALAEAEAGAEAEAEEPFLFSPRCVAAFLILKKLVGPKFLVSTIFSWLPNLRMYYRL